MVLMIKFLALVCLLAGARASPTAAPTPLPTAFVRCREPLLPLVWGGALSSGNAAFSQFLHSNGKADTPALLTPTLTEAVQIVPVDASLALVTCSTEFTPNTIFYLATGASPPTITPLECGAEPRDAFVPAGTALRVFWVGVAGGFPGESVVSLYFAYTAPAVNRFLTPFHFGGLVDSASTGGNWLNAFLYHNQLETGAIAGIDTQEVYISANSVARLGTFATASGDVTTNFAVRLFSSGQFLRIASGSGLRTLNIAGLNTGDIIQVGWFNGTYPDETHLTIWVETDSVNGMGYPPSSSAFVVVFGGLVVNTNQPQYLIVNGFRDSTPDDGSNAWRVNGVVPRPAYLDRIHFNVNGLSGTWIFTFTTDAPGVGPLTFSTSSGSGVFNAPSSLSLPAGAKFTLSYPPNTNPPLNFGVVLYVYFRYDV